MKRSILLSSAAAWCCLGLVASGFAAPPPAAVAASKPAPADKTDAAVVPAKACLTDIKAFSDQMQKDGYWLGGSAYGYGYPLDGYGYGVGYGVQMAGHPPGISNRYQNARSGYEIRNLIAAANILAQDGQQQTCEAVLASTRDDYKRYAAELHSEGMTMADGPDWQRQQVAAAVPVTDKGMAFRSDQLLDTDVRNPQDQGLGSVHDLIVDPKTSKIAYLIVARGGVFGFDRKYVPIPWDDFKMTQNASLLVLDATKAAMDGAPEVTDDQFTTTGHFDQESQKVDAYWKTHLAPLKSGG
jgi:sporulation protein YlmC with PRC-barrel domain